MLGTFFFAVLLITAFGGAVSAAREFPRAAHPFINMERPYKMRLVRAYFPCTTWHFHAKGGGMLQKVNICGVDTAGLPKLSHKENEELMRRLKSGDKAARDRFIIGNMRLVLSLVKRFWAKNANADDVFQAGCVGLIKAIDGFDLSFNVKFSTYAVPKTLGRRNTRKGVFMTRKQAIFKVILKIRAQKGQCRL